MTSAVTTSPGFSAALLAMKDAPAAQQGGAGVDKAAKEFEAVFLSEMLSHMFEGIETDPMFGGGKGEEVFRGMMVSEYGKMIADSGGIGISGQIKAMMIEMQGG